MKKVLFVLGTLLFGMVFSFTSEANAAKHEHLMQSATAYVGSTTGHGATYGFYNVQYSTVAVKKKYGTTVPIIPFGTAINLTESITLDGANISKSSFTDTGLGSDYGSYWIDFYYGFDSAQNRTNASLFGVKPVSYTASY
ncbi:hypothetical protein FC756_19810 [Lysinibacillus mangiferihumi]|uniref:Uncharacterized protein n=1 Tax=Lysinibacillus mangiferihumi TaxID=1130819 RepID=A0A4U2YGK9_9BACI|nr:hypothetical protein [Lysinibacillus mangiferihumi]TKI60069.1 hypothetical protein FC756_19810 [Lysinibacillus mangiferihumi]